MSAIQKLDWFVHEGISNSIVERTRAKILGGIGIMFGIIILGNASRGFLQGSNFLGVVVGLCGILMLVSTLILRQTGFVKLASNLFLIAYYIVLTLASYMDGGPLSQIQYNFVLLITLGYMLCGLRNGSIWLALSFLFIILMQIMLSSGHQFPPTLEENMAINLFVLVPIAAILAIIYEASSSGNLKNFSIEKTKSDNISRSLENMFADVEQVMEGVAQGDLTKRVTIKTDSNLDTLKESINSALELLSQTILQVQDSARQIDSGSSQLSSSAQAMASGTSEQAASMEQISSSMNEIGTKAKINNDSALQAQKLSGQTAEEVTRGNKQMEAMQTSMNQISETSSNVSKVIKTIDEIAFQTNLLALNAAVEAARAGKYGKGFAVVAEEVRNLASRSAEAAKDTTQLIESSIVEVESGVKNADQMAEVLTVFVDSVDKIADHIGEISFSSQTQATGVEEINTSLEQVNNVIQQNSSISEETASASEQLSSQAEMLMNLVNRFKLSEFKQQAPNPGAKKAISPPPESSAKPLPEKSQPNQIPSPSKPRQIVLDDDDFGKY